MLISVRKFFKSLLAFQLGMFSSFDDRNYGTGHVCISVLATWTLQANLKLFSLIETYIH